MNKIDMNRKFIFLYLPNESNDEDRIEFSDTPPANIGCLPLLKINDPVILQIESPAERKGTYSTFKVKGMHAAYSNDDDDVTVECITEFIIVTDYEVKEWEICLKNYSKN